MSSGLQSDAAKAKADKAKGVSIPVSSGLQSDRDEQFNKDMDEASQSL